MGIVEIRAALGPVLRTADDLGDALRVVAEACGGVQAAWAIAQAAWRAEDDTDDPPLRPVAEWCASLGEPREPNVRKLLPPNGIILLSAKPKSGKTFFALQIADDVASGRPVLGRWEVVRPGPVAYFSMEDPEQVFRDRCTARGLDTRKPPLFIYKGQRDISTEEGAAWLAAKVEPIGPKLIVIDTARQALAMENWNDAAEVTRRLRPLMRATARFTSQASVLLVAHNNKNAFAEGGDRIAGSNALQSNVDGYILLEKKKRLQNGDLQGIAECEGRIDMPEPFAWVMDSRTHHIRVMDDQEATQVQHAERAGKLTAMVERVERALEELGGEGTAAQLAEGTGLTERYVRTIVRHGEGIGRLGKTGEVAVGGGRSRAAVYGVRAEG